MLRRIIIHWTAGKYTPNSCDLNHYHFLINNVGDVLCGIHAPQDNICCNDGVYAAHTKQGNTGSIGIAMCGMYGFKNPKCAGDFPLTKMQCEACFEHCAKLMAKHNIPIDNIYTHYEFNKMKNIKTGKIDIVHLPPYPEIEKDKILDFIKNKISWYQTISQV
jgi:hypothetical protein